MAEYQTEEERRRAREKAAAEKLSAGERITAMTKEKEQNDLKLRTARKEKSAAEKAAKEATLAANKKSATYPMIPAHYLAPVGPLAATAAAIIDGRMGSKEDVASWVATAIGFLGAVGAAVTDNPTGALAFSNVMAGGLSSIGTRRGREFGARMRSDAASRPAA